MATPIPVIPYEEGKDTKGFLKGFIQDKVWPKLKEIWNRPIMRDDTVPDPRDPSKRIHPDLLDEDWRRRYESGVNSWTSSDASSAQPAVGFEIPLGSGPSGTTYPDMNDYTQWQLDQQLGGPRQYQRPLIG
jgi:hypothetical protein